MNTTTNNASHWVLATCSPGRAEGSSADVIRRYRSTSDRSGNREHWPAQVGDTYPGSNLLRCVEVALDHNLDGSIEFTAAYSYPPEVPDRWRDVEGVVGMSRSPWATTANPVDWGGKYKGKGEPSLVEPARRLPDLAPAARAARRAGFSVEALRSALAGLGRVFVSRNKQAARGRFCAQCGRPAEGITPQSPRCRRCRQYVDLDERVVRQHAGGFEQVHRGSVSMLFATGGRMERVDADVSGARFVRPIVQSDGRVSLRTYDAEGREITDDDLQGFSGEGTIDGEVHELPVAAPPLPSIIERPVYE